MEKVNQVSANGMVGEGVGFERIRRITGYLVGTLDRFNNAKRAEEHDRVKSTTWTAGRRWRRLSTRQPGADRSWDGKRRRAPTEKG